jgi:nitrile hydratase subunit beta
MDGIHDLGGRQGFGPIDVGEPSEPFHAEWEGRLLGIVRGFTRTAPWSIDWFRHVRECIEPTDYLTRPYYDQWMQTYAAMMIDSGVVTLDEIVTGHATHPLDGVPPPSPPETVEKAKVAAARFDRNDGPEPAFQVGDTVRARLLASPGHTRLPQYARGHRGSIVARRGNFPLPDTNMRDDGPAEPLYTVSFAAADLWPEAGASRDRVLLDLWESYLERA